METPPEISSPIRLAITGDWTISVTTGNAPAETASAEFRIAPPDIAAVDVERHDNLPDFDPKAWGGWKKGATLEGVRAQECSAKGALDPESLLVWTAHPARRVLLDQERDYEADLDWGSVGRLPSGRLEAGQSVLVSYRYALLRIDSIVRDAAGGLSLLHGEPDIAVPLPPEPEPGHSVLANIFLSGRLGQLDADCLFPVLERAYPEPPTCSPTVAERLLPKTVAKLRSGAPLRVLAWGDSVTHGGYLPRRYADRWQVQFIRRLKRLFPAATIELLTEAWGGHNTAQYLAEPPGSERHYPERVLALKPDLVITEFVNDAFMDIEQTQERYGTLLADFHSIGAEWVILTPHYVRPDWMGLQSLREIDSDPRPYVAGLRSFASRHRLPLADASRRWGRLWRQGIPYSTLLHNTINHPDVRGMKIFADSLMELFETGQHGVQSRHFEGDG